MSLCFVNEQRKANSEFINFVKCVLSCANVIVHKNGEEVYKVVDQSQAEEVKAHRKRFSNSQKKMKLLEKKIEKRKQATMKARTPEMIERIKLKNIKIVKDFFSNKENPDPYEVARRLHCGAELLFALQRTGVLPKRYVIQLQREISPKLKEV